MKTGHRCLPDCNLLQVGPGTATTLLPMPATAATRSPAAAVPPAAVRLGRELETALCPSRATHDPRPPPTARPAPCRRRPGLPPATRQASHGCPRVPALPPARPRPRSPPLTRSLTLPAHAPPLAQLLYAQLPNSHTDRFTPSSSTKSTTDFCSTYRILAPRRERATRPAHLASAAPEMPASARR